MDDYYSEPSTVEFHKRKREVQTEIIQSSSLSNSNFSINNLPDFLLIEILIRLPSATSAFRCKSVCKFWFSLLSTHYFVHRFLHHLNNNGKIRPFTLIVNYLGNGPQYKGKLHLTSKELLFDSPRFKLTYLPCFNGGICILASFNDLLLCCASMNDHNVYYICNPLTMQWVALPPTPSKYIHDDRIRVGFICDQCDYGNDQEEYRYVVMRIHVLKSAFAVEIFSSETGKWREFEMLSPEYWSDLYGSGVAFNGVLHWLSVHGPIIAYNPYDIHEHYRLIDGPKITKPENFTSYRTFNRLGVCCGFLRILHLLTVSFGNTLTVWELKNYNTGEWRLIYKINVNEMISNSSRVTTLDFHPNNGDIIYLRFGNHIVSYNMQRSELKEVSKIPFENVPFDCNLFPLELPWWPTPLPRLPRNVLS